MAQISFKQLLTETDDSWFIQERELLTEYTSFYFVDSKDADRNLELEKIGQYLEQFERRSFQKDGDLAGIYASELYGLIENYAEKGSRADRYLNRANEILNNIKTASDQELSFLLEDLTSIYLCAASEIMKDRSLKIKDLIFDVTVVDFKTVLAGFNEDNPYASSIANMIPGDMKGIKDVKKFSLNLHKNMDTAQKKVSNVVEQLKKNNIYEPVHDVIENEDSKSYSKRSFTKLVLILIYYQIMSNYASAGNH